MHDNDTLNELIFIQNKLNTICINLQLNFDNTNRVQIKNTKAEGILGKEASKKELHYQVWSP